MTTARIPLAALVAITLLSASLDAQTTGIVLVEEDTRQGRTTTNRIQLDADRVRVESHASGEHMAFVFDGPAQVARMLNLEKQTYTELSQQDLERIQQQLSAVLSQMEEQLRNLPPAQREMMEKMMGGQGMPGMPAEPVALSYRRTGADQVGPWPCTTYEALSGSEKFMEICAADAATLGLTAADFTVLERFAEFLRALMPQIANQAAVYGTADDQGFEGLPVRRTMYEGGSVASVSELTDVRREAIPASAFEVPDGFRREALPGLR